VEAPRRFSHEEEGTHFLVISVGDGHGALPASAGHDIDLVGSAKFAERSDIQSGI